MKLVPLHKLKEGMIVADDVATGEDTLLSIVPKHTTLTSNIIKRLKEYGVKEVRIIGEDEKKPPLHVEKPAPIIDRALRENAVNNLEEFFSLATLGEEAHTTTVQVVKQIDAVVKDLVASVAGDKNALININDLKSYDEYTYHHSLSVAVLAIAIAQSLGFSKKQLEIVGRCAMMHDIGKTAVPIEIINKPARLSDGEFAIIKKHSEEGFSYLNGHEIGDEEMWLGVLFHHEKFDGTGYPKGLKGERIPLLSRIISVADVYDALTSMRPYRTPMQPQEAAEYIMANIGTFFDYDVVLAFLKKLELYPVGSFVELSDRRIAVVLDNVHAMRPIVQLVDTREVMDLYADMKFLSITISRLLSDDEVLSAV
ncbi:MAG: HD-GYP domain-containing protein [Christensenellaceae bacterium]|jgi:putative nucleotidyltransferase with HDIG domain